MVVESISNITTKRIAETLATTLKGMLLVAFLDNKLHWHEHQTLIEFVRTVGDHATAEKTLEYLDEAAHMLEGVPPSARPALFEPARHLPSEAKVNVLAMCTKLAFSDGRLTAEESKLIHLIAEWIDIDPPGRKLWKEGVRGALKAAQMRGYEYDGIENLDRPEKVNVEPEGELSSNYALASRAYAAGEMEKCVSLLQAGATDGDASCQALLGTFFQDGDAGLKQDLARAVTLLEQAASQYNVVGTFLLARTHYFGIGVEKDEEQGIRLFKRAALMNYPEAQAMLTEIYTQRRNFRLGGAWLLVAASNGHTEAKRYIEEQGDPPDVVKHLASRLIESIHFLKLMVGMNPKLALAKLAEMEKVDF